MMDPSQQQEQFSRAYVHAVATVAGFSVHKPEIDVDSIDMALSASGLSGQYASPRLDAQLKCTHQDVVRDSTISYPLKTKNYDDLRAENVLVPRMLIVVVVPGDVREWMSHSEDQLVMRRCGWWFSLRGFPASDNEKTVTVSIPRSQVLSPEQLITIMSRIASGGFP
jgi:hypothetical protein